MAEIPADPNKAKEVADSTGGQILLLMSRHNQPSTEHGQAAIASSLMCVAEAINNLAAAVREGNDDR